MDTPPTARNHGNPHLRITTTCGRQISVGLLALGDLRHPAERISLDVSAAPGVSDGSWTGLTAGEARALAAALLAQVAAAERAAGQ